MNVDVATTRRTPNEVSASGRTHETAQGSKDRWGREPIRVVTIARQHGTGGESIAEAVARELGFRLMGYDVIRRAADQAGTSPEAIDGGTRHRGVLSRILEAMAVAEAGVGSAAPWVTPMALQSSPLFTSADYRAFVEQAIREVADEGNAVIVGHGAQLVLADRPNVLRVLITGSVERRIARAIAAGIPQEEAEQAIRKADEERVAYFREFYVAGWLDPSTYDLIINTDRMQLDDATDLIIHALHRRQAATEQAPMAVR